MFTLKIKGIGCDETEIYTELEKWEVRKIMASYDLNHGIDTYDITEENED